MSNLFETLKQNFRINLIKIYEKGEISDEEALEFKRSEYLLEYYCVMNKKIKNLTEYYLQLSNELDDIKNKS